MNKFVTFETTLSKKDIELILRNHFDKLLSKEDVDFKDAKWMQDDYTYSFKDGDPSIGVVIMLDECKIRKPK